MVQKDDEKKSPLGPGDKPDIVIPTPADQGTQLSI